MVVDHLSHLGPEATLNKEVPVDDSFLNDEIIAISHQATLWYADLVNYKICGVLPPGLSYQQKKEFLLVAKYYVWEEPLPYKLCGDGVYKRCLS